MGLQRVRHGWATEHTHDLRGRDKNFLLSDQEKIMLRIPLLPSWWRAFACWSIAMDVGRNWRDCGLLRTGYLVLNGNIPPLFSLRIQDWQSFRWSELFGHSPFRQETARVNINILGISKLKWTWMNEFSSDGHYIYYCGQESLRRNGVAIIVNKRVWNAVLGCNLKNDRMISVFCPGNEHRPFLQNRLK